MACPLIEGDVELLSDLGLAGSNLINIKAGTLGLRKSSRSPGMNLTSTKP